MLQFHVFHCHRVGCESNDNERYPEGGRTVYEGPGARAMVHPSILSPCLR
jgi:hypothetical protein